MISSASEIERRGSKAWVLLVAVLWAGCETLQLGSPIVLDETAWTTEGGSSARTFEAASSIDLPLEELWVYNAEGAFGPAPALAADGKLFLPTRQGEVRVLSVSDERQFLGQTDLGDAIDGAPVLADRLLIAPISAGGRSLVAYDVVRGSTVWVLDTEPHAAGLLLTDDHVLVAASLIGTVRSIDPRTGDTRWEVASDSVSAVHATPVLLDAKTFAIVDDQGTVQARALTDGAIAWTASVDAPVYATPAQVGDLLLVPTTRGRLVALDAESGQTRWTYAASTAETRLTTPSSDGRTLYVGASTGTLAALDVETGALRWTHTEDGVIAAAPLLVDDTVFIGTLRKRVLALDAATGTVRWQTEVGGRVKTAPIASDGYLFVLAEPRQVYAFGSPARTDPPDSLAAR
ncbi:MAG: PQQ-binding-like beta-propeller repeat protein [Bacteroidota bacterium]